MKTLFVLSVICACALAAPSVSIVGSPLIAAPLLARSSPLLAAVAGEAPASTVHAAHVKQVIAPQVVSYSLPAVAPQVLSYSLPAVHSVLPAAIAPPQVIQSVGSDAAVAPAQVISAYSLPAPVVSDLHHSFHFFSVSIFVHSPTQLSHSAYKIVY